MQLSGKQVQKAGETLIDDPTNEEALSILNAWRLLHFKPLCQMLAASDVLCSGVDGALCVGRIKRTASVVNKLKRQGKKFKLQRFNDIAAYRIIVPTIDDVYLVNERVDELYPNADTRDYISDPHPTGYRSLHRILRIPVEDRQLRFELQIRTQRQHAFATFVEFVDDFNDVKIKSLTKNDEQYITDAQKDFMNTCMSVSNALYALDRGMELSASERDFFRAFNQSSLMSKLQLFQDATFEITSESVENGFAQYLLTSDRLDFVVRYSQVLEENLEEALKQYNSLSADGMDGVLVNTKDFESLATTYPLYAMDSSFICSVFNELSS